MKIPGLFKKLCAATLAMTIAASGAVLTVCAADRSDPAILDRTDVRYNNNQEISRMSASENIELVRTVADGYMNFKKKIDISSYHLPVEAAGSLHTLVCAVYPEIFFVDDIRYTYWHDDNGYLTAIQAKYLETDANGDPDKETISKQLQEFYNEADRYLALVSDELSACRDDFSKALVLHDELVLDVHYDINSFSNYNLLVKKYGLCRSYARIYAYLLGQLGIKTKTIYSKDMNHVWLKVCLDGTYYNVDPTWDDPTPDESGKVSHSYFLFSDGAKSDHYNYFSLYSSTNKKYDNIKLHNYNSKICKINANDKIVYAIDNNNHKLVKYNYATNTETTLLDLNSEKWKSNANGYTWNKSYSSLEAYDGYLFYNTPDKIWRYDPSTGKAVWFWTKNGYDNKQIFGLRIENGNLYSYASEYSYSDTTKEYIGKASDFTKLTTSVIISPKSVSMYVGDKKLLTATRTPNNSSDGLTFSSSDSSIATTEITNGKVYVKGIKAGKAVITAETSSGIKDTCIVTVKNKTTAIKAVTLKTTSYTYDGKAKKPSVTVKDANGKTVSSSNYTVSYSNNTKTGKAKVTVKGKGNYTGTISKTFTIKAKSIAKAKV
ncbi:MAG: Ig-like domain-containing protein [Clostridia bacterium]|nr:Ig-like domain-containing protein [Clostridia bacterium]